VLSIRILISRQKLGYIVCNWHIGKNQMQSSKRLNKQFPDSLCVCVLDTIIFFSCEFLSGCHFEKTSLSLFLPINSDCAWNLFVHIGWIRFHNEMDRGFFFFILFVSFSKPINKLENRIKFRYMWRVIMNIIEVIIVFILFSANVWLHLSSIFVYICVEN